MNPTEYHLKLITLLILSLITSYGSAQFNEQFTDRELTSNPAWSGNLELFSASNQYLESNYSIKTNGHLSTPLKSSDYTAWHFDCALTFRTTATTYVNIFLISDTEDPSRCNNGYYLSLRAGEATLCRIKNKTHTTLTSLPEIGNALSSIYQYQIERKKGNWKITIYNGAALVHQSALEESQPIAPSGYFSIYCALNSVSSFNGFTSQFIEITSLNSDSGDTPDPEQPDPDPEQPDTPETPDDDTSAPIAIKSAVCIDSLSLRVTLNRSANLSHVKTQILFHDTDPQLTPSFHGNELFIKSHTPFEVGKEYALFISGIVDPTTGLTTQCSHKFSYYPSILQPSSLRISELMVNPNGVKEIPPVEYVEIYNASKLPIQLSGYGLLYGDKRYILPAYNLPSKGYAILTHEKNAPLFAPNIKVIPLISFPILNNTAKKIGLSNPVRQTIQLFEYSNSWYGSKLLSQGGYSLECIDLDNPINDASNWSASRAPQGGTPGEKNSIQRTNTDRTTAHVTQIAYPNNDQIRIRFSKEMNIAELQKIDHYQLHSARIKIQAATAFIQEPYEVTLYLNMPLDTTDRTSLTIDGLTCRSALPIVPLIDYPIALPVSPNEHEICINEILFNPKEGGCDYLELHNRSTKMIDLSELILSSRNTLGEMVTRKIITSERVGIPPNHLLLLTTDTAWVSKEYGDQGKSNFRKINSLPPLNNKNGNIILLNRSFDIIDQLEYDESFHTTILKDKKGIAIERLSSEISTQDPNNWGSASEASQWGTPGYPNSQQYNFQHSQRPFTVSPQWIEPNSGHRNDHLFIQYDLPTDELWVDIQICTLSAFVVKTICAKTLLSGKGMVSWDGKNYHGIRVRKGIYIVYIKSIDRKNIQRIYRYDVVVG